MVLWVTQDLQVLDSTGFNEVWFTFFCCHWVPVVHKKFGWSAIEIRKTKYIIYCDNYCIYPCMVARSDNFDNRNSWAISRTCIWECGGCLIIWSTAWLGKVQALQNTTCRKTRVKKKLIFQVTGTVKIKIQSSAIIAWSNYHDICWHYDDNGIKLNQTLSYCVLGDLNDFWVLLFSNFQANRNGWWASYFWWNCAPVHSGRY